MDLLCGAYDELAAPLITTHFYLTWLLLAAGRFNIRLDMQRLVHFHAGEADFLAILTNLLCTQGVWCVPLEDSVSPQKQIVLSAKTESQRTAETNQMYIYNFQNLTAHVQFLLYFNQNVDDFQTASSHFGQDSFFHLIKNIHILSFWAN